MAGEWIDTTVGEQATLQRGIDITKAEQRVGPVPVISSGGVSSYHDTPAATGPGVVLGRKGVVGSVYFVSSDYWPHDTTLWVKNFHGNEPRFVYYFFRWMAPRIATLDVGSANPTLNRNHVHPIEIRWPSQVAEQRAIAHILGTLDDKIELNRKINETLEAMAQALFKNWFVDFEPFRDQGMEDSPLGPIPKGWGTKPLDQIAGFLNGLALQKYPPNNNGYLPVIKIAELRRGITDASDKASVNIPAEYVVNDGDILFSWSGSLEIVIWCYGTGALNQHLFKVTSTDYPRWFLYYWIKHHLPEFQAIAASKATTMGHIQRHHLTAALASVPPRGLLQGMDKVMSPIWDRIITNKLESRTLATIRDTLLPKLLSGEIRVKDAERFVERAV